MWKTSCCEFPSILAFKHATIALKGTLCFPGTVDEQKSAIISEKLLAIVLDVFKTMPPSTFLQHPNVTSTKQQRSYTASLKLWLPPKLW